MGEIPHSEKMFHLPIEVSVYVPSTQDVDKVVSKSEMKLRVEEVKKYLATLFGGFSSSSVEGGFLASDGKVVKENVERVVSFAPKEDFDKNKEALVQKASEWAAKWGQEAIGLEHEGDLYYVPQKFENGGTIAIREAKEMANSQAIELKHHISELANVLKKNPTIEAWVIAKLERASSDLSDVTHYLDGRVQMSGKKMATGGNLPEKMIKVKVDYLEQQYFQLEKEIEIPFSEYKEYDKTGKVSRELIDDLISETSLEHHVETNAVSVRLTPITADKMATGGGIQTFKQKQLAELKVWKKSKLEDLKSVSKSIGITSSNKSYISSLERLDKLVSACEKVIKSGILKEGEYFYIKEFIVESYKGNLQTQASLRLDKFLITEGKDFKKDWTEYKQKFPYADMDGFIAQKVGELTKKIVGYSISSSNAYSIAARSIGGTFADGGVIDPNSMEVQFIKYKDEEIMYEPHFKEYYVNDSMFHSLEEAKQFIDGGAPMSPEIKEAYRKGLFKDGGNILLAPNGKPSKLTLEQYKLVRTPEFKAWFGDWESDPENASKVVDENGEPKVVTHSTPNEDSEGNKYNYPPFKIFDGNRIFSTPNTSVTPIWFSYKGNYVMHDTIVNMPFFIKIKNLFLFNDQKHLKQLKDYMIKKYNNYDVDLEYDYNNNWEAIENENLPAYLNELGFDGYKTDSENAIAIFNSEQGKLADGTNTTFDGNNPDIRLKDGGSVGGRQGNNSVLKSLFNNPEDITPIKFNGKTVGGIDVTTYRGDTETLRVHMMLILPEFQGKGIGAKAINKLFRDNPNVKQIIGNATAESKSFWQKIGAEFHSNEHTAFTITRNPDMRFDAGGNMEFERPSYQSNYVASQAQANEIADDKWNMDYENDPLIKAQKKAKEIAKKVKETAKRAAMAYATKGMSETNRQTNGAAGGASEGGDEMSGANKMDMASMFKGMK